LESAVTKQDSTPAHRIEARWAYPFIYAVSVYLAAFVPELPWWAYPAMGLAAAAAGTISVRHLFGWLVYGEQFTLEAGCCALLAGVGAAGWLGFAHADPVAHWQWLVPWLVIFGGWWATLCWRAPAAARVDYPATAPATAPTAADGTHPDVGPYPAILRRAGVHRVAVTNVEQVADGALDIVTVEPLPVEEGKDAALMTYEAFSGKAPQIATEVARHFRTEGLRLEATDVMPLPGRDAAEYLLHVARRQSLKGEIPFVLEDGPQKWCRALELGLYEDMRPIELTLCHAERGASHLEIIGESGSGKGVVIAVVKARLLSSDEGEVWVIGTDKMQKLTWGWLAPWLSGETDRPVLDRVGGPNVRDALEALADALHFVSLCNADCLGDDARVPTRGKGGLAIVIDEASDLLERRDKIKLWDGREMNASELVAAIKKAGRTGPVSLITANQDNLFSSAGTAGPKSKRNSSAAIVLSVRAQQDASQPLAGLPATVNPTKLKDNMMYVRPNIEEARVMRGKAQKLRGPDNIAPVAAALTRYRYGLDPDITAQLRHYQHRWAPARHPELAAACERLGWAWPVPAQPGAPAPAPTPAPTARPGAHPPAAPTQEAPVPEPTQPPSDPAAVDDAVTQSLPDGWARADYDVFAALAGEPQPEPAAGGGGLLPAMDVAGLREAGQRMVERERARLAAQQVEIPDPLGLVLALVAKPGAPEWVATEVLAVATGRIAADAPAEDRRRAAEQLGNELFRQTGLKSEQASRSVDSRRRRGFSRDALLEVGRRLLDEAS
jgi:hypothetical protein